MQFLTDGTYELDYNDSLTNGLKHAWVVGTDSIDVVRDLTGRMDGTVSGGASLGVGPYGRELIFDAGTKYVDCGDIGSDFVNNDFTVLIVGRGSGATASEILCAYGGTNYGWGLTWEEYNSTNKIGLSQVGIANNASSLKTPVATAVVAAAVQTAGFHAATNGNVAYKSLASPSPAPSGAARFVIGGGLRWGGIIDSLQGGFSACYLWNRRLSPEELAEITINPWRVLRSRRLNGTPEAVGGGGGSTGTGSGQLSSMTGGASGAYTPPAISGVAAAVLAELAAEASGAATTPGASGAANGILAALTATGSGIISPPSFTATATGLLFATTSSAIGSVDNPGNSGTVAGTLYSITGDVSGGVTVPGSTGTSSGLLSTLAGTASGTFSNADYTGSGAGALTPLTATAVGEMAQPGSAGIGAGTLATLIAAANGTAPGLSFSGSGDGTLGAITGQATGTYSSGASTGAAAGTLQAAYGYAFQTIVTAPASRTLTVTGANRIYTAPANNRIIRIN